MLSSFMNRHILTEAAEIDSVINPTSGLSGDDSTGGVIQAVKPVEDNQPEEHIDVEQLAAENEDPMKEEDEEPIMEAAIDFCRNADDVYLLTENTICKMRIKAVELSTILESASASDDKKKDAAEGVKKLSGGAIKAVLTTILQKIQTLMNKFAQFVQTSLDKLSVFQASLTKWSDNEAVEKCDAIAGNPVKMKSFRYQVHNWNLDAFKITDATEIVKAVNTLLPRGVLDNLDSVKAKKLVGEINDYSIDDFKRKLLKTAGFKDFKQISVDAMASVLSGGEAVDKNGINVTTANFMRTEVDRIIKTVMPNVKNTGKYIISELTAILNDVKSFKATGDMWSDQMLTQYAAKRAAVATIAISLVNMIMSSVTVASRNKALEYMRIVNTAGKHAGSATDK